MTKKTKVCLTCKKTFKRSSEDGLVEFKGRKYCSLQCFGKTLVGEAHPYFGKKHTEEWKQNKRKERIGFQFSNKTKLRMRKSALGRTNTEEQNRKIVESHLGEKHWNWQGGISSEPYSLDWTEELKENVRKRDNYKCQECGRKQTDKLFPVHHIDYNKKNSVDDNLITLCISCHIKTNGNREQWQDHFNKLVAKQKEKQNAKHVSRCIESKPHRSATRLPMGSNYSYSYRWGGSRNIPIKGTEF